MGAIIVAMENATIQAPRAMTLPPVILHPFADAGSPMKIAESSRANLMLQGLMPPGDLSMEDIEQRFLSGRFCEIRMLFYVGKDLERWVEQCVEMAERDTELAASGLTPGSFIQFLVEHAPAEIREKLERWGVADYRAIFRRAVGLKSMFADVPEFDQLSAHFIRYYYRYADKMYLCRLETEGCPPLPEGRIELSLYASGEYTRMLERQWEEG